MSDDPYIMKFSLGDIPLFSSIPRKMKNICWQYEVRCELEWTGGFILRDYRVKFIGKKSDVYDAYMKVESMMREADVII